MIKNASLACVTFLLLAGTARADLPVDFDWSEESVARVAAQRPEQLDSATPEERAKVVAILMRSPGPAALLGVLERASALDRFRTLQALDRSNATTVRRVHDALDAGGRSKLLALVQQVGRAGTAAGLQQLGVVSDCDDTAFPTTFTPDGAYAFKGSADFYRLVSRGTDGRGDGGNLHFVTARVPFLFANSRLRLHGAGIPSGTFDGDASFHRFAFGGLDGIQQSKIENVDLWLRLHPGKRFLFLGDTLQRDPEVYRWVLEHHPDQVEMVLIHKAGGPERKPEDYRGEVFFDDYVEAQAIVRDRGIVRPGARLAPDRVDVQGLPLPDTDVAKLTATEKGESLLERTKNFVEENLLVALRRSPRAGAAPAPEPARTRGLSGLLEDRLRERGERSGIDR